MVAILLISDGKPVVYLIVLLHKPSYFWWIIG